jgi:hypothetical protein
MTKQDLESGMIVKTRNGNWYLVDCDELLQLDDYEELDLEDYYDDLTSEDDEEFDIVLVANLPIEDVLYYVREKDEDIEKDSAFELIWSEKSKKEEELEKVISDFERQLKEAKEELENL